MGYGFAPWNLDQQGLEATHKTRPAGQSERKDKQAKRPGQPRKAPTESPGPDKITVHEPGQAQTEDGQQDEGYEPQQAVIHQGGQDGGKIVPPSFGKIVSPHGVAADGSRKEVVKEITDQVDLKTKHFGKGQPLSLKEEEYSLGRENIGKKNKKAGNDYIYQAAEGEVMIEQVEGKLT